MNYDPNSNNLIKKNKTDENDIGKKKVNKVVNGDKCDFADIPVNEIVTEFVEGINSYFDTLIGKESTKYIYKETKDLTEEQQDEVNQLVAHTIKGTNLVTKNQVNSKITNALKDVFNQVVKAGTDGAESKYDELSSESDLIEF